MLPIDWLRVERLCLQSFTGGRLTDDEMTYLHDALRREPEEYIRRTHAVRDEERNRMRSL
jgi:hypothetical protein